MLASDARLWYFKLVSVLIARVGRTAHLVGKTVADGSLVETTWLSSSLLHATRANTLGSVVRINKVDDKTTD